MARKTASLRNELIIRFGLLNRVQGTHENHVVVSAASAAIAANLSAATGRPHMRRSPGGGIIVKSAVAVLVYRDLVSKEGAALSQSTPLRRRAQSR
ncbi:hypothetical protein [Ensifer adhaerens]|uniref:hypothetical protein n=1 Tax=Ensifer adhaerens TaxID=106592 RepID=UPI001F3ED952|nr:hypothetical protein [Ensifer adhaerens]